MPPIAGTEKRPSPTARPVHKTAAPKNGAAKASVKVSANKPGSVSNATNGSASTRGASGNQGATLNLVPRDTVSLGNTPDTQVQQMKDLQALANAQKLKAQVPTEKANATSGQAAAPIEKAIPASEPAGLATEKTVVAGEPTVTPSATSDKPALAAEPGTVPSEKPGLASEHVAPSAEKPVGVEGSSQVASTTKAGLSNSEVLSGGTELTPATPATVESPTTRGFKPTAKAVYEGADRVSKVVGGGVNMWGAVQSWRAGENKLKATLQFSSGAVDATSGIAPLLPRIGKALSDSGALKSVGGGLAILGGAWSLGEAAQSARRGDEVGTFENGVDGVAGIVSGVTSLPTVAGAVDGALKAGTASAGVATAALAGAAATGWGVGRLIGKTTGIDKEVTNGYEKHWYSEGRQNLQALENTTNFAAATLRQRDDATLQKLVESDPRLVSEAIIGSLNAIEVARENKDAIDVVAERRARTELNRLRAAQRGELHVESVTMMPSVG